MSWLFLRWHDTTIIPPNLEVMENTSINKKASYSTYSCLLSGDYLFRKITGLPQWDNSAVETNTPIRSHIWSLPSLASVRLLVTLVWSARAWRCVFFLFFLNVHQCVCVCEPRLLSHAESLDVSGQFMCDSDEPCGGDGLSVIWLTEQPWIIPAALLTPRPAVNDFIGLVMTSSLLFAFWLSFCSFVLIRGLCAVCWWHNADNIFFFLLVTFASPCLLLPALSVPFSFTSSWPRLLSFSPHFPVLSFCFSYLSFLLTFALTFLSLLATSVSFPFFVIYSLLFSASVYSLFHLHIAYLFLPFPHLSSLLSLPFSLPHPPNHHNSFLFRLIDPLTISLSVLPVWPRRSHQVALWPSVHGAHQDRPDARLQWRLYAGGRSRSHVEPHSGGCLFTLNSQAHICGTCFTSKSFAY